VLHSAPEDPLEKSQRLIPQGTKIHLSGCSLSRDAKFEYKKSKKGKNEIKGSIF